MGGGGFHWGLWAARPAACGGVARGIGQGAVEGCAKTAGLAVAVGRPGIAARDAWIASLVEVGAELLPQFLPGGAMGGIGGEVVDLVRIGADVVEFLEGALAVAERELDGETALGGRSFPEGFDGGAADVAVKSLGGGNEVWSARRPAVGREIADLQKVCGAHLAQRVGAAIGSAPRVALKGGGGSVARRVDAPGGARREHGQEAAADEGRRRGRARGFEKGRREIEVALQVVDDAAGGDAAGPAHRERHAHAGIAEGNLGAGERHAVVAGDHDEGVVEFAEGFELRDYFGELRVEGVDLAGGVEQVAADFGGVGPVGRDRDVGEALAGFESGACFFNALRLGGAELKEKRCAGGAIAAERVEIFCVGARRGRGGAVAR